MTNSIIQTGIEALTPTPSTQDKRSIEGGMRTRSYLPSPTIDSARRDIRVVEIGRLSDPGRRPTGKAGGRPDADAKVDIDERLDVVDSLSHQFRWGG